MTLILVLLRSLSETTLLFNTVTMGDDSYPLECRRKLKAVAVIVNVLRYIPSY